MKKTAYLLIGFLLLFLIVNISNNFENQLADTGPIVLIEKKEKPKAPQKPESEKILENLTVDQKIGQLFMVGFDGKEINSDIENLIKETHPGGVLLLARNIGTDEEVKKLISSLQEIAINDTGLPLFIAIDQEGTACNRICDPEDVAQGDIKDTVKAYQAGLRRGEKLKDLGINLNLSPLADDSVNSDFIYDRTFKKNTNAIGYFAQEFIRGQKEAGIFSCLKHFPGYKGISFNPEELLASVNKVPDFSQFKKAAEIEPELVMTANVIYKDIDPENPLTFSQKGISFLKENIKGDYLIITDDLSQNSLLDNYAISDIVAKPVKAGVDILIFSGWRIPVEDGYSALKDAYLSGELADEEINRAALNILNLKISNSQKF